MNSVFDIRKACSKDIHSIFNINTTCIPHVNRVGMAFFKNAIINASCFFVAVYDKNIAGFIIAFDEYQEYSSPNYLYFKNHFNNFLYIDRIAVGREYRSQNIGSKLYDTVLTYSKEKFDLIACEVNTIPPNPISLLFHENNNFIVIDKRKFSNGKSVVYLKKEI